MDDWQGHGVRPRLPERAPRGTLPPELKAWTTLLRRSALVLAVFIPVFLVVAVINTSLLIAVIPLCMSLSQILAYRWMRVQESEGSIPPPGHSAPWDAVRLRSRLGLVNAFLMLVPSLLCLILLLLGGAGSGE